MRVDLQWAYQEATICVFASNILDLDDDELERAFLHECIHILTGELAPANPSQAFREHFEHVATMLSLVLVRTQDMVRDTTKREINAELRAARSSV